MSSFNLLDLNFATGPYEVIYWPDGTAVLKEDFKPSDWTHKSDDYACIDLNKPNRCALLKDRDPVLYRSILEEIIGPNPIAETN